jgi:hypothetical protein
MATIIRAFAGAAHAATQQDEIPDILGIKQPTQPTPLKESKSLIDLFRQFSPPETNEGDEFPTFLFEAADRGDLFELQWYTLFVMYTSNRFRAHLCLGAPKGVCDRMLNNFVVYLDQHLFGTPPSKTASTTLYQSILTPIELVPRFLSDLHMAYFASDQTEPTNNHGRVPGV